jgi:hypothetical protein
MGKKGEQREREDRALTEWKEEGGADIRKGRKE